MTHIGPFIISLLELDKCLVCDKTDIQCNILYLDPYLGWIFCSDCTEIVREQAINNMIYHIPLKGVLLTDDKYYKIMFERSNKETYIGYIDPMYYIIFHYNNIYHMRIKFNSSDNKEILYKDVPLTEIYKYNPYIYEKIINSTNLFNHNIIMIRYNDLTMHIKTLISCI